MQEWPGDLVVEVSDPPRMPESRARSASDEERHPLSYAQMPILQCAIAHVKWGKGINGVAHPFPADPQFRQSGVDPAIGKQIAISRN